MRAASASESGTSILSALLHTAWEARTISRREPRPIARSNAVASCSDCMVSGGLVPVWPCSISERTSGVRSPMQANHLATVRRWAGTVSKSAKTRTSPTGQECTGPSQRPSTRTPCDGPSASLGCLSCGCVCFHAVAVQVPASRSPPQPAVHSTSQRHAEGRVRFIRDDARRSLAPRVSLATRDDRDQFLFFQRKNLKG
jgi:hypothetical protein